MNSFCYQLTQIERKYQVVNWWKTVCVFNLNQLLEIMLCEVRIDLGDYVFDRGGLINYGKWTGAEVTEGWWTG